MTTKKAKNPKSISVAKATTAIAYYFSYACPHCSHKVQEKSLTKKPKAGLRTCPNPKCGSEYKVEVK